MFPVNFKKQKSEYYLQCLSEGKNIEPQDPAGWTINEMAALAGACFFVVSSHGPIIRAAAAKMQGKVLEKTQDGEHKEADDEVVFNDIRAGIEFIAQLTMLVCDGQYDEAYEEFVQCGATQEGELERKIAPIAGFKDIPDLPDRE